MMPLKPSYQSFPWQMGASASLPKLNALHLPNLSGKRVLDVGCNTGFFCGFAAWQGASEVVGVDFDREAIQTAKNFFPQCRFLHKDWNDLGGEKFDVILFISAIHYAHDQVAALDMLMRKLTPHGMLVLEIGVAPGNDKKFARIERSIDARFFPTREKLKAILEPYAAKYIGKSIQQIGDPIPRYIYHLNNRLPEAILFMDAPHSGKTALTGSLFRPDIQRISGDMIYFEILSGQRNAPEAINAIIDRIKVENKLNCYAATCEICRQGHIGLLCDLIVEIAAGKPFILDMAFPKKYRDEFCACFDEKSYFVLDASIYRARAHPLDKKENDPQVYEQYLHYLSHDFLIDDKDYLAANPCVAKAIADGVMPNAQYHWWNFGRFEGRKLSPDNKKG